MEKVFASGNIPIVLFFLFVGGEFLKEFFIFLDSLFISPRLDCQFALCSSCGYHKKIDFIAAIPFSVISSQSFFTWFSCIISS